MEARQKQEVAVSEQVQQLHLLAGIAVLGLIVMYLIYGVTSDLNESFHHAGLWLSSLVDVLMRRH